MLKRRGGQEGDRWNQIANRLLSVPGEIALLLTKNRHSNFYPPMERLAAVGTPDADWVPREIETGGATDTYGVFSDDGATRPCISILPATE